MRISRALLTPLVLVCCLILGACAASEDGQPATAAAVAVVASETPAPVQSATVEPATPSATAQPAASEPAGDEASPAATMTGPADEVSATPVNRDTATPTRRPSATPIPSETPTSAPQFAPVLLSNEPLPLREGVSTPATAIPTAVPVFTMPQGTTNVLLLGSDAPVDDGGVKRTDTMIIVSISREGPTASMISLPRDLYVYIPGGTMNRLNTAITLGGPELLKQTILYNFGIPIHFYARVDFDGFEQIVDAAGGVDMAVSCHFRDWRIKSPELDPEDEDNWYVHEMEPGFYHMDGATALWYARSRLMSDDFDRGRRQQQLLRAMLNQGIDLNLLPQAPALWNSFQDIVDTDMDIGRMLLLASSAPAIRENGVQNLYLFGKSEPWTIPETNAQVLLPIWEGPNEMGETFQRLFLPPALNKATRAPITVEVVNAGGDPDLALLAADNLAWYGFVPIVSDEEVDEQETSSLTYFAPNFKSSYDWLISWITDLRQDDIVLSDDSSEYDYRFEIGQDYDPCLNQFFAPQSFIN